MIEILCILMAVAKNWQRILIGLWGGFMRAVVYKGSNKVAVEEGRRSEN